MTETEEYWSLNPAIQFAIWGYAYTGSITEPSALIAEGKSELIIHWDGTAASLDCDQISDGRGFRRVKDWAACPWIGEHMRRGHAELISL